MLEHYLVRVPDSQFLAHGTVGAGGPVDEVIVVLAPSGGAFPDVGCPVVPFAAVYELYDGQVVAHLGESVEQEASGVKVDGGRDGAVAVHDLPAVVGEVLGVGAHMVGVVVRQHKVVDLAAGLPRSEMLYVPHDDVAAGVLTGGAGVYARAAFALDLEVVAAGRVHQHSGAVGQDVVEGLAASAVDGMYVQVALLPRRQGGSFLGLYGIAEIGPERRHSRYCRAPDFDCPAGAGLIAAALVVNGRDGDAAAEGNRGQHEDELRCAGLVSAGRYGAVALYGYFFCSAFRQHLALRDTVLEGHLCAACKELAAVAFQGNGRDARRAV